MTPTLELLRVRKAYGEFVAVDDLSLVIEPGEIYGLLGPNGAGKTSTIRMIIGITLPDSGEIRIFGEGFHRGQLQRVGYLPEERGHYKRMKVVEQLSFFAQLHGMGESEARQKARWWCERMEIDAWMDHKIEELSKGMQQKIQFIGAMVHEPQFIILDEPASGLDPVNAALLNSVILELKKQGRTILFSTHRMDQVEKLCDSICLINRGKAVLQGELREVKSRYGTNHVQLQYDGTGEFLEHNELIHSFNNYGSYVEVRLAPGADSQKLLRMAADKSRVHKFEVMEPTLEEIFIDVVEKDNA
jgi:ABC-2 type transport system ATP-binding protein